MINLRKLELSCGLATMGLAFFLSAYVLKSDWDASVIVKEQFLVLRALLVVLLLFLIPGALVGVGSYAHAAQQRAWGQVVLAVGCAGVVGSFLFWFVILPFYRITVWSGLNISFILLAVMTLVFSLMPRVWAMLRDGT